MDVLTTTADFSQHPRDVWFAGDVRESAFQPLLGQLATRARMRIWPDMRALLEAAASAARMPAVILVASSRGGPLAMAPLESLRAIAPSSTVALLLGPWSGGVLAKQKLPAGIERVSWHERERLARLIDSPLPSPRPTAAGGSRLASLVAFSAAEAEIVLELCSQRGVPAIRSLDARTQTSDVGVLLWRFAGLDVTRRAELAAQRARHPAAAVIALVESLRPCEKQELAASGCSAVLAWPCELAALEGLIADLQRRLPAANVLRTTKAA
jgi:hypothetical protein